MAPTRTPFRPRRAALASISLALALASGALLPAQQATTQPQDPEFAGLVREWTTSPEFLSPLVDHLPLADGVPTPKDFLGYHIGAPKTLTGYAEWVGYQRALAQATPRVRVISMGSTDEGRDHVIVFVSSEANIASLEQTRANLAKLADPRRLTPEDASAVIAQTKPIYHLMGGLHSGETGPPEMLLELAYRLAVSEDPLVQQIREHVIVSMSIGDPDGRDRYVQWYRRHLVDIEREEDRLPGPPYWGKYVFHDNNRDINYSQVSMRNLLEWYLQWHPPILHDLHESVPFLYTYSGQAPQNPNYDPILFGELPWFANFEMAQLTRYGMPGVWTHGFMDAWSPGYLGSMAYNHNGLMRMYETFGNGGATTMKRRVAPREGEGGPGGALGDQTTRQWFRPLPPYREVVWSMRNNTNYMQTGVLTALQLTSQFPSVVLENFYAKSRNSIEDGRNNPPHGFVIPAGQRDMTRVATLVNILRTQGIEIGRASAEITVSDGTFPAGSYVIKRDQPYGRLAKILLEKQDYPDPSLRTYDDSGWTMGLAFHAEVKPIDDKAILGVRTEPVDRVTLDGTVAPGRAAAGWAVMHTGANGLITLRYRLKDVPVKAASRPFTAGGRDFPAGSLLIPVSAGDRAPQAIAALGLTAAPLASMPDVPVHDVDLPRIAVFSMWTSTQEVGWVRHAFDQFEIPFDLIYKERVRQGDLRRDYDVIVMPSQGANARAIVYGSPAKRPLAYTKTDEFPSHGMYGETDDITGGFGLEGVLEFQRFLDRGGLLITMGNASTFPVEFGLARDVDSGRPSPSFYAPRPIVEAEIVAPEHPVFYGYPERIIPVKYLNGPLLQVPRDRRHRVLMQFPGGERSVLSGLMRGAGEIRNRPAIVDVPAGEGRVLVFATNPIYRWQNHAEFTMIFNALLHWNDLPKERAAEATEVTEGFTTEARR